MKTIKNSTTIDLIYKVQDWAEMVEMNDNTEVLLDIAVFFDKHDYVDYFYRFLFKESLKVSERNERDDKGEIMLADIYCTYGKAVQKLLQNALGGVPR